MYAIVEIAGQQFKVEEGKKIFVHHIDAAEGDNVEFEKVLLTDNEGVVNVGEPFVENTIVGGRVLAHVRGDKVIIFKKKKRKGYQKRTGHRQDFTQVEILSIGPKGAPEKQAAPKAVKKEPVAPVTEEVKEEVKKTPAAKKTATKKETTEIKEPATKKTAAKKTPATKTTAAKTVKKQAKK